jgi:RNA polymerase sigma-70 factor (ECF subfamily)
MKSGSIPMLPDAETTQQLLQAARQGDSSAVNELLERHRDSLRRMVQARLDQAVARRVDASDVVQDVLLEAHGRLNDYLNDGSMPFQLWLRHLAKDRMIDVHRRHRAQRRDVLREQSARQSADVSSAFDLFAQISAQELTPAAASIRREMESRFLNALQQLDDIDREILLMRHCEQLGNSEVAELLGLSQPAAGMRYLRALRRLRTVLGMNDSEAPA